ncbi:MAG: hypothetical protein DRQ37_07835, partial [Gammaproteobacteria bacterium]
MYRAPGAPVGGGIKGLDQQGFIAAHLRIVIPAVCGVPTHQFQLPDALLCTSFTGYQISIMERCRVAARQWAGQDGAADGTPDIDDGETLAK